MKLLSLKNVSKNFGALKVTDDVSFTLNEGEALGIIGPNGAGKSTLFNLITGSLNVAAGTIEYDGVDITRSSAAARCLSGIGRSFQIPQPFEKLTVFENLVVAASFGRNLNEAEVTDDCVEILEKTELIGKANAIAGSLSLLERKRLELARAMSTQPKLLLLDEIAGGLTDGECLALVDTIRAIHKDGVSIIWIEHVLHALNSVVERLLVLDFGRVIEQGEPQNVMNSPEVKKIYLGIDI
ncbi:MAG: ABC transporter ATP-binding protein [Alphaproteobacteria bacterium]|nr:ABC transporter ATP-binding protein [Alphaproteobacteria bacterium]